MGILKKLLAAGIQTATLPVQVVKDVATLGGTINSGGNYRGPYAFRKLKDIGETVSEAIEELKK